MESMQSFFMINFMCLSFMNVLCLVNINIKVFDSMHPVHVRYQCQCFAKFATYTESHT